MDLAHSEYRGSFGSITYSAKDIKLNYNFEAGREYCILFSYLNEEGKYALIGPDIKQGLVISYKEDWKTAIFFKEMTFSTFDENIDEEVEKTVLN
jgi:hypothetical protein